MGSIVIKKAIPRDPSSYATLNEPQDQISSLTEASQIFELQNTQTRPDIQKLMKTFCYVNISYRKSSTHLRKCK